MTGLPRDRDSAGRARNRRARDELGRPLDARADETSDPPALAPPEALAESQRLLDAGRPFEAHEVLEAVWKDSDEATRDLWRGLAQVAVGITHALRDNPTGARTLLARGAGSLVPYAGSTPYDIDVDGVRRWASETAADLSRVARPPRLTR